ncbi:hypothetical protein ACQZV8_06525 [Magnetococcales bacterium HHB-1]
MELGKKEKNWLETLKSAHDHGCNEVIVYDEIAGFMSLCAKKGWTTLREISFGKTTFKLTPLGKKVLDKACRQSPQNKQAKSMHDAIRKLSIPSGALRDALEEVDKTAGDHPSPHAVITLAHFVVDTLKGRDPSIHAT